MKITGIQLVNDKDCGVFHATVFVQINGGVWVEVINGVSDDTIIDHTIYESGIISAYKKLVGETDEKPHDAFSYPGT